MLDRLPVATNAPHGVLSEAVHADAEPDVTWGTGGIDDCGWTAVELASHAPTDERNQELP